MNDESSTSADTGPRQPAVVLGAILVVVGAILFAGQMIDIGFGELGWPLWIVGIGVAILLVGFFFVPEVPVVVAGTIVTTVGLVLLYQEATDHWESWAYAWALVGPAASGLGMALWGLRRTDAGAIRNGLWGMLGGLAFFVVGLIFFEGVIGISGRRLPLPDWTLPAAIIAIGTVILLRGLFARGEPEAS